jgi:hypothetical protein
MPRYDLFDVIGYVDPANVKCAVLAHERTHTAHVIAVVAVLVTAEAVHVRVKEIVERREAVEIFAFITFRANLSVNCQ